MKTRYNCAPGHDKRTHQASGNQLYSCSRASSFSALEQEALAATPIGSHSSWQGRHNGGSSGVQRARGLVVFRQTPTRCALRGGNHDSLRDLLKNNNNPIMRCFLSCFLLGTGSRRRFFAVCPLQGALCFMRAGKESRKCTEKTERLFGIFLLVINSITPRCTRP